MSSFSQFLQENKIPDAQLLGVSRELEHLTPEDRTLYLKRRDARKAEKKYGEVEAGKPRSGRGVSSQALEKARADKPLPRKVRSKIVHAINTILKRRGQKEVRTEAVFGKVTVAVGKPPVKKK